MAKQAILHGETMTISMNISGSDTDYVFFNISCFSYIASLYSEVAQMHIILSLFRTDKCFKLGWPMDIKADFFVQPDDPAASSVMYNRSSLR